VPPKTGSKVRLFNLAADVPSAGLSDASGKALVSGVKYTLGSVWAPIPAAAGTFTATSATGGTVASAPMTPPNAPQVFTAFLLGVKGFGYTLMPQIDAPVSGGTAGPVALLLLSSPRVRAGVWAVPTRRCRAAGGVLGQLVGRGRELIIWPGGLYADASWLVVSSLSLYLHHSFPANKNTFRHIRNRPRRTDS